jgi:serine/threonine protein kinase
MNELLFNEKTYSKQHLPQQQQRKLVKTNSLFSIDENIVVKQLTEKDFNNHYEMDLPFLILNDYGFLANFNFNEKHDCHFFNCSVKAIAKSLAFKNRMDTKLLQEKQFLAALNNNNTTVVRSFNNNNNNNHNSSFGSNNNHYEISCSCLPTIEAIYQNERMLYIIYKEHFVCDLACALANNAVAVEAKVFYLACLYSAILALHENGLMHRFFLFFKYFFFVF